jgi:hypothetical protein
MADLKEDTKEEVFPTHEEIEKRAYELYLTHRAAGREDSYEGAVEDWLIAEQQLIHELSIRTPSPLKNEPLLRRDRAKSSSA